MARGLARTSLRADVSPLTFEELAAACQERFCSGDENSYGVRADEPARTIWITRPADGLAVGIQQMQVARLGLEVTLERAERKLRG